MQECSKLCSVRHMQHENKHYYYQWTWVWWSIDQWGNWSFVGVILKCNFFFEAIIIHHAWHITLQFVNLALFRKKKTNNFMTFDKNLFSRFTAPREWILSTLFSHSCSATCIDYDRKDKPTWKTSFILHLSVNLQKVIETLQKINHYLVLSYQFHTVKKRISVYKACRKYQFSKILKSLVRYPKN